MTCSENGGLGRGDGTNVDDRFCGSAAPTRGEDLGLTPRQLEVLRLLVQGLPNKSIARRLDIAETTARGYVSELLAAFRVTDRTQLVLDGAKRGLLLGAPTTP